MRVQVLTAVGALAVGGFVLAGASAQERPRREGRPDRAAIQAELGLTADQTAQMKKLRAEWRKDHVRRHADLAVARLELSELMDASTVDEKAVAAKVKTVADLQASALEARTEERLAMRRILSPEQQEKLKLLRERGRLERGPRPARAWRHRRPGTGDAPPGPGDPSPDEGDDRAPGPPR